MKTEIDSLGLREKQKRNKRSLKSGIGFSATRVRNFSRYSNILSHKGCVNAVKWINNGEVLLSGSDDRSLKLWDVRQNLETIGLLDSIQTKHRGNIFCVDVSSENSNLALSAAADGTLRSCYIDSKHAGNTVYTSDDMIHMFVFDCENPNVLYTAEESGFVNRIDLRTNSKDAIFFNSTSSSASSRRMPGSVKIVAQCQFMGSSQLFVGGKGFDIGVLDLRLAKARSHSAHGNGPTDTTDGQFYSEDFVKTWSPCNPFAGASDGSCAVSHALQHINTPGFRTVSASGLHMSKNGRSMVVNYQGDQIYTFDLHSRESASGATAVLGGHINYSTFLKGVSFFGPRDEFVVAGSDSGHIWVWDSHPTAAGLLGNRESLCTADYYTCKVVNVLDADYRTCNGVVPHPHAPLFASYGIDSDVKIWGYRTPDECSDATDSAERASTSCTEAEATSIASSSNNNSGSSLAEADFLTVALLGKRKNSSPVVAAASRVVDERFLLCMHRGEKDKHRYDRLSLSARYSGGSLARNDLEHCALNILPSLLEKNKKSAVATITDMLMKSQGPVVTPRVVDAEQFNRSVYLTRSTLFSNLLTSTSSAVATVGLEATPSYNALDRGCYMPSDYVGEALETESLSPSDVTAFAELLCSDSEVVGLGSEQTTASVERSLALFNKFTLGQRSSGLGLAAYAKHVDLHQHHKLWRCMMSPIGVLFVLAHTAKQNGNFAFKNKDLDVAHYFYCKAFRYVKYLLDLNLNKSQGSNGSSSGGSGVFHRPLYFGGSDYSSQSDYSFASMRDSDEEEEEEEAEESEEESEEEVESPDEGEEEESSQYSASVEEEEESEDEDVTVVADDEQEGEESGQETMDQQRDDTEDDGDVISTLQTFTSPPRPIPHIQSHFVTPVLVTRKTRRDLGMDSKPLSAVSSSNSLFAADTPVPSGSAPVVSTPARLDTAEDAVPLTQSQIDKRICRVLHGTLAPELGKTALSNLVACFIQMNKPVDALNVCDEALSLLEHYNLEPDAKLLFRRGSVNLTLSNLEEAQVDLLEAQRLSPKDSAIATKLKEVKKLQDAKRKREFKIYNKMFD